MKSDVISIKNEIQQADIENVLSEVEKLASYQNLDKKQALHLRLLAEELIGFQKGILGFSDGEIYIENKDSEYKICLHSDVKMDVWSKERAVEYAKDHTNAAYKGFKGKMRMIMDTMFSDEAYKAGTMDARGFLLENPNIFTAGDYDRAWAMSEYREGVEEDTEDWDMLEHSVLASIADDIIVAARNNYVDIIVVKKF